MTSSSGPAPASGTVTLLFTDIEASTRLLHAVGDAYREIIAIHHRLLREAIAAHGGWEVDTAGDGFFVSFPTARNAVDAAAQAQRALQAEDWPQGAAVRVRMGLHTGEPTRTDSSYVGLDVHLAARICGAAHGGQVLLSETTRRLVGADLPEDLGVEDLGSHRLKDIAEAERLFQLTVQGLPQDFPPVRAEAGRIDNLPTPSGALIGRRREVETVGVMLSEPDTRIVTLTGPGGTGKTRLALAVGSEVGPSFEDGVCFTPLASIGDPGLVIEAVAKHLGVPEHPGRPAIDTIREGLQARHVLLVLDNFEHVTPAADQVGALVRHLPQLKILVTSRVALRLTGEREYPVPPLSLPGNGSGPRPRAHVSSSNGQGTTDHAIEDLISHAAVALFVDRARKVRPGFALSADNAEAVSEICRRVDGLPLALELAAARIKLLSPSELLQRLERRLDFLTGGSRDAPERHRALRQTIAFSHELLSPEEQIYFRRMSVFMGGSTLEAVASVCRGSPSGDDESPSPVDMDPFDAVATLLDQSLVRRTEGQGGQSRFGMLETIREFGLECLATDGEEHAVRRAHAEFFHQLARDASVHLTGPDQARWMNELEVEHDNFRAALAWGEIHDGAMALSTATALWRFWISRGYPREGREWLVRLLRLPGHTDEMRGQALNAAGTMSHEMGEPDAAGPYLTESLSIARRLEDRHGEGLVLNNLGWVGFLNSDLESCRTYSNEALGLYEALGDFRGQAVAHNNMAWAAMIEGDWEAAEKLYDRSLELREAAQDPRGAAFSQSYRGTARTMLGRYDEARTDLHAAVRRHEEMNTRQGLGNAYRALSQLHYQLGEFERAVEYGKEGAELFMETGTRPGVALCMQAQGRALASLGRFEEARRILNEARALTEEMGIRWGLADVQLDLGRLAAMEGRPEEAREWVEKALGFWTALGAEGKAADCRAVLGDARVAGCRAD